MKKYLYGTEKYVIINALSAGTHQRSSGKNHNILYFVRLAFRHLINQKQETE